jgi:undecaprenyl-diphosphatase
MNTTAKSSRVAVTLAWLDNFELRMCRSFNTLVQRAGACRAFQVASRLGDGVMWYCLIGAIAVLGGRHGALVALQMAVSGLSGLLLYRWLKHRLVRERPFITHASIKLAGRPLDRFSFPSGHTLHAVAFTVIACAGFPWLAVLLVPAAALIALSRVVLGLHYPSDVLAGALIGLGVAFTTVSLIPIV